MKTITSCMFTIERRIPWNQAQTHTVQEFGSPEHRDTASPNANKFNLAIDEENIDFNISGVPNAMVKRSHGINVHNLILQIENHPQRQAFSTSNMELKFEFGLWIKTNLSLGSEFLLERSNMWSIQFKTIQKFLQIHKTEYHKQARVWLQPGQRRKQNPQPRELAGMTAIITIHQRKWIDIEPSKQDLESYDLSKKVVNLLRHNQTLYQDEDGAIEFPKIKVSSSKSSFTNTELL